MVDDLVRDLTGRSDVRRASAVERCAGLPEDLLLEITSRLLVSYQRLISMQWLSWLAGAIGVVSLAYLTQGNTLFIWGAAGLVHARYFQLTNRHTGRSLQALLNTSEDKRLIAILLLKYTSQDGGARRSPYRRMRDNGLTQLLPYVADTDDEMWTPQMRSRLASVLRSESGNMPLTMSVLHALAAVGDANALAPIDQVISAAGDNESPVRAAAEEASQSVRARIERRNQASQLLRPSAANDDLHASLPRAVGHELYSASGELARSALSPAGASSGESR